MGRTAVLGVTLLTNASIGAPATSSNATLKGTDLYSESGVLEGKSYAESGPEVDDGNETIVLTYQASDGCSCPPMPT